MADVEKCVAAAYGLRGVWTAKSRIMSCDSRKTCAGMASDIRSSAFCGLLRRHYSAHEAPFTKGGHESPDAASEGVSLYQHELLAVSEPSSDLRGAGQELTLRSEDDIIERCERPAGTVAQLSGAEINDCQGGEEIGAPAAANDVTNDQQERDSCDYPHRERQKRIAG
jgi:hypothetical protein